MNHAEQIRYWISHERPYEALICLSAGVAAARMLALDAYLVSMRDRLILVDRHAFDFSEYTCRLCGRDRDHPIHRHVALPL